MKIPEELKHKSRIKVSGIYQITNNINGQKYIGSSDHLYRRCSDHNRQLSMGIHSNPKLQNSWNKYGKENFSFSILEYAPSEIIRDLEQDYINRFRPELNIAKVVGYPNTPKPGTIEAKLRSQKNLEARRNSEWCKSQELHEIMSAKLVERWTDQEYRNRRIEETKQLWKSLDYRNKLSELHKKIKDSDRQEVARLRWSGYSSKEIAVMFDVSYQTIDRIVAEFREKAQEQYGTT